MIRILTSLVAVLTASIVHSQALSQEPPKLVVGITIDQLRGDYLDYFQHTFSEKGFKRLLNEGIVYQNIDFGFPNITSSAAIATIYTGVGPSINGIVGDRKYLFEKKCEVSIFYDNEYLGNYTSEKISPKALSVSTIADELKIASQGFSDVFAFAPNQSQAIVGAGHAGNGAYWIEDYSGKWATTTYYKDFYWIVEQENKAGTYSTNIRNFIWKPLLSVNSYKAFPYTKTVSNFQHNFGAYTNPFLLFKTSAYVNENIRQTALKVIEKAEMGKRSYPDFLSLTFYAGNYINSNDRNYSLEIQDTYARLDKDISILLDEVDRLVGLKNALIFVTSTGYYESEEEYPASLNMPNNIFYSNRCQTLLNMYLTAIYGLEQWVEYYYNDQIYLNRKLIEQKGLKLEDIQNKAAEFVIQFSGVRDVATSLDLLSGKANQNMSKYKNLLNRESSGDIFVEIQPGYKIINETLNTEKRVRETAINSPVIFFGYNIKPEKINRTVKAEEIAPTVCRILRIRSPNASKMTVLPELK